MENIKDKKQTENYVSPQVKICSCICSNILCESWGCSGGDVETMGETVPDWFDF